MKAFYPAREARYDGNSHELGSVPLCSARMEGDNGDGTAAAARQEAGLPAKAVVLLGGVRLMAVPFIACMALSAALNNLPAEVLPAIHTIEGGRIGTVSRNRNGTEDLGVMQVNTIWVPRLARATGLHEADVRTRLIENACWNIVVAGAIVRIYRGETNGDLWRAVGNYHSHTPARNLAYQAKVLNSAVRLLGGSLFPQQAMASAMVPGR
jgi:hypothetical protein